MQIKCRNVFNYWMRGEGGLEGFQYVNLTSSRLLSRLRSTSTSGGPSNWSLSSSLETEVISRFFASSSPSSNQLSYLFEPTHPASPEYCVNFGRKNINFLLRKCRAQGRHYANGAHVMMSPDTKMSPRNTITAYFPSVSPPSQTTSTTNINNKNHPQQ